MNEHFLSIIIPAFNADSTLGKTIASIKDGFINIEYEIVVVDDGSTDLTLQVAQNSGANVVVSCSNKGPAFARNLGAKKSKGTLLLFADSDIIFRQETIVRLLQHYFYDSQEIVCAGFFEKEPLNKGFGPELIALQCYYYLIHNYKNFGDQKTNSMSENVLPSYCALMSRETFNDIGGFDTKYKIAGGEEHDFGFRLGLKDIPIKIYLDCPVGHHFRTVYKMITIHFKRGFNVLMTIKNYSFPKTAIGINYVESFNILLSFLFFCSLPLLFFSHTFILPMLLAFAHIATYRSFYFQYVLPEKGVLFLLRSIPSLILLYFSKGISIISYFFVKFIFRKEIYY